MSELETVLEILREEYAAWEQECREVCNHNEQMWELVGEIDPRHWDLLDYPPRPAGTEFIA